MDFNLTAPFKPQGSQPEAIAKLLVNFKNGKKTQTLLGVTGSGKSLDYEEIILIKSKNGKISKVKIGDFVERNLYLYKIVGDTYYQKISGYSVYSFNPKTYFLKEKEIVEVSKHKEDSVYEILLDDNSSIRVTKDHNCFRVNNMIFELCKTSELKLGDYLPTSNIISVPGKKLDFINLLEYIPGIKVNIKNLLRKYDPTFEISAKVFTNEFRAPNWKIRNIINETKERGIAYELCNKLLIHLNLNLEKSYKYINLITKKKNSLTPLIKVDKNFLTFAGLYLAEGHNAGRYILISNSNIKLQSICKSFYNYFGLHYTQRNKNDIQYNSLILSNFFKIFGTNAYNKKVPSLMYNLSNRQLSIFLSAMFDGDGWVEKNAVLYLSASKELVFDIKSLLLRFGITSRITLKKNPGLYYQLSISGRHNLILFKENINFSIGYKIKKLEDSVKEKDNTNVDLIPNCNKFFKEVRKQFSLSQKEIAEIMSCERSYISMIEKGIRSPSKKIFKKLALWLCKKDAKYISLLNLTKYNFRKIIDIRKIKSSNGYVYDISVKGNENFMAGYGNIFVHNTFTMANIIQELKLPTIVIAHNKTLAAQLYNEFKEFFPKNRVEYFVSYYDYYQPESYIPQKDQYIEKDSAINPKLEQMRLSATASLLSRKDVIVVASVSCIYGLGDPENYKNLGVTIEKGMKISRNDLLGHLVSMLYERNDTELMPGRFRVRGDTVDIVPSYSDDIIRIQLLGSAIESIKELKKVEGTAIDEFDYFYLFPARHFVIPESAKNQAIDSIKNELKDCLPNLGDLEAHRLKKRTMYDIEMIQETGYCKGIENYSRHFDMRKEGEKPYCLLDYFPDDFLMIIDESHQTIPQLHAMYNGDRSRKKALIDYGFRLPSAYDNRPLKFSEFENYTKRIMFVSATPAQYELTRSDEVVEQIIRPTGLVDPVIEIRKTENQVSDIIEEIKLTIAKGNRTLVTTLTKKLAEELSEFLAAKHVKTRYLHSEVYTLERTEIIRELRLGIFDVLVGINLLREGLDIPEIGLIGILDADKEGFLRDERSLIQTIGRAARNPESKVILYADRITDSIRRAVAETSRRRNIQIEYNTAHGITPMKIIKPIKEKIIDIKDTKSIPKGEIPNMIIELEAQMKDAAEKLNFEEAIALRDRINELRKRISGVK